MAHSGGNDHASIKKRFEALIKKAQKGDVYSMRVIAEAYAEGEYLPRDYFAAEAWLRKAGELGSDEANKKLAKLLTDCTGVARGWEEAFDIYHELMMDCDLDGMEGVGLAYKFGRGIHKDEKKGSFFLKHAFEIELDLMEHDKENNED